MKWQNRSRMTKYAEFSPVMLAVWRMYEKNAPLFLCEGLLFIALAVFLFVRPVGFMTVLTVIIGIGLILFGLYRAMVAYVTARSYGGGWIDMMLGLVNVILGVLFCVYPGTSLMGIIYAFVILFLIKALRVLGFAINMTRVQIGHYKSLLGMAILLVLLAVVLMVFPMAGAVALVYYMAITLLLYAVADLFMFIELLRLRRGSAVNV